jgi:hypothetical protein
VSIGPPPSEPPDTVRQLRARIPAALASWPALVGGIVGLYLAFAPTLSSGLARMQVDWGDTRLNNYILEHGYRWLRRMPGHLVLWSPPIFYPAPNTAAYSDILLGVAPFYWPWRLAGVPPDTTYQLWMISLATVNYLAALICCRRLLRLGWAAATVGAFVFAFGSIRIAQLRHAQLLAQFYWLLALYALERIFEVHTTDEAARRANARRPVWIAAVGASVVLQLYAGYYLGWFLAFSLTLGLVWALILPSTRNRLVTVCRQSWRPLAATAAVSAIALVPLALPYIRASHDVGLRPYSIVTWYLPRIWSWMFQGGEGRLYGWLFRYPQFRSIPEGTEHHLGIGVATTLLVAAGLWLRRREPMVQLLIATSVTIVLLCTVWPNGTSAWILVYRFFPGAGAVRGVSRIALALLIPAGVGAAFIADRWRRLPLVVAAIGLVIATEQWQSLGSYDKIFGRHRVAVIADAVRPDCLAFLYTPPNGSGDPWWYQTDAMWASIQTGVPTINGYSGNTPPGWTFYLNIIGPVAHDSAIADSLRQWASKWSLDRSRLCRITTPVATK